VQAASLFKLKIELLSDSNSSRFPGRNIFMQPQAGKEENHNILCEELLRERVAVLSRAGMAVEDAVVELTKLDDEIQIKNSQLKLLRWQKQEEENLNKQQVLIDEINVIIDQFNEVWQRAQMKYYYLIVTREALGLRWHDRIKEIYLIPDKKMQAF
jgi:hypothetical protein